MNPAQRMKCHLVPSGSSTSNAREMDLWLARPTVNSIESMGSPNTTRKKRYMRMKAAPPYSPVM